MLKPAHLLSTPKASSCQHQGTAPHGQKHHSNDCLGFTAATNSSLKATQAPQAINASKATAFSAGAAFLSLIFALNLTGCTIEQEPDEEHQIEFTEASLKDENAMTPVEKFIAACNKCVLGDTSNLPKIVKTYLSTYTASIDYPKNAFTYQYIDPHQAFERCALKAMKEGDSSGYDNLIVRPARIARIARYFYSVDNPTQGAYWLQRIINTQGESRGLEVAGRIFIQHPKTIGVGVRLLEQSARIGNTNARSMLLGLMNPSSSYYQELTRNTLSDAIDNTEPEENKNKTSYSDSGTGKGDTEYDDMNNANPDFEDNSEYAEDAVFDEDYNEVSEATATALKRSPDQQKINAKLSASNRATAQENIRMLAAKTAAAKAAAAKQAAAERAAAKNNPEVSPLDALDSNDIELNIPMGLYEKRKPFPQVPSESEADADANAETSTASTATTASSAASATSAASAVSDNSVTEAYQQENQDRMHELEDRAEAAAQKVRERMAQRQAQLQNATGQSPATAPNTDSAATTLTAPAPDTTSTSEPNTAPEATTSPAGNSATEGKSEPLPNVQTGLKPPELSAPDQRLGQQQAGILADAPKQSDTTTTATASQSQTDAAPAAPADSTAAATAPTTTTEPATQATSDTTTAPDAAPSPTAP